MDIESKIDANAQFIAKFNLKANYTKDVLHHGNLKQEGEFLELARQQEREMKDVQLKKDKVAVKAKKMHELLRN